MIYNPQSCYLSELPLCGDLVIMSYIQGPHCGLEVNSSVSSIGSLKYTMVPLEKPNSTVVMLEISLYHL